MKSLLRETIVSIVMISMSCQAALCEEGMAESVDFVGGFYLGFNKNNDGSPPDFLRFDLLFEVRRDSYMLLLKYSPSPSALAFGYSEEIKNSTIKNNIILINKGQNLELTLFPNHTYNERREIAYLANQLKGGPFEEFFTKLLAQAVKNGGDDHRALIRHYCFENSEEPSDAEFLSYFVSNLLYCINQNSLQNVDVYPFWFKDSLPGLASKGELTNIVKIDIFGIKCRLVDFIQSESENNQIVPLMSHGPMTDPLVSLRINWIPMPTSTDRRERMVELNNAPQYMGLSSKFRMANDSDNAITQLVKKEISKYNNTDLVCTRVLPCA